MECCTLAAAGRGGCGRHEGRGELSAGSRSRATGLVGAALLALPALVHALPAVTTFGPLRKRLMPVLAGRGGPGHVALTFDDGPDPASTPQFLTELARLDIRATFFVLGVMLQAAPDLGRRIVDEGHEVAVHGWDHRSMLLRTPQSTADGLERARDLVTDVTGRPPRFFRPPYGVLTASTVLVARELGLQTVLWTGWGEDWSAKATPESVVRTLAPDLAGGATLLLHDSDCTSAPGAWQSALGAVPEVVRRCRDSGWTVGPLVEHSLPLR